ncbi:MAG: bile acid:sodium symporter family protein [Nodosilinea sp.]
MDIKELLTSFAQITLFAVMLSMGMALRFQGMAMLWRRPGLLLRCTLAAFVVVPLAAMVVTWLLPLPFTVRAGIGAMAIIPGAPVIYRKMQKGPGDPNLAGSFQATMALLSIVLVPLWLSILAALYPNDATVPLATLFKQIMAVQFIPLVVGAALSQWLPDLAEELDEPLHRISTAMLAAVLILVLVVGLRLVLTAGPLPVLAVSLMAAAALLAGHILAGPDPVVRQTIAIANASRNTGLALVLITLNFPAAEHDILVTLVAYALISGIAGAIYSHLYKKRQPLATDVQDAAPGV